MIEIAWGYHWWVLHPGCQKRISDKGAVTDKDTDYIVKYSHVFFLYRSMHTPLTLPNGKVTYPSATIPPMRVHRVHLKHGERLRSRIADVTDACLMKVTK